MNTRLPVSLSRAALALAAMGFVLGTWAAPASAAPAQRATPPVKVTVAPRGPIGKPPVTKPAYGGTTCTWDGNNGSWDTAARWSCGHVPSTEDDAVIDDGNVLFGAGIAVRELRVSGGFVDIPASVGMAGTFRQTGGTIVLRQDGRLAFPQGHPFVQDGGKLIVEIGGASRFGRMDFDNHIGGLGLFGLGGELTIFGLNGYVPADDAQFLFMNGSSMSASSSAYLPTVDYFNFPSDFKPVLGLFSGVIRNIYPGACRYTGGFSLWSVASNWSCGRVPTESDTAILEGAQVGLETADATVGRLVIRGNNEIRGVGGHTLTALGIPQPNELAGGNSLTQALSLVLGNSRVTEGLSFSLYNGSSIENLGRFEMDSPANSLSIDSHSGGFLRNAPGGTMDLRAGGLSIQGGDMALINEGELLLRGPDPSTGSGLARLALQAPARLRQVAGRFVFDGAIGEYYEGSVFELEGGELAGDNTRLDMPVVNSGGIVRPGLPASCGGGGEALAARGPSTNATSGPTPDGCSTAGYLEVLGYTQGPGGALEFQFGTNGDEFSISGPANLDGTLLLRDYDGARPPFDLNLFMGFPVTGFFSAVDSNMPPEYSVVFQAPGTIVLKYNPSVPTQAPVFVNAPPFIGSRVAEPYTFTFNVTGSPTPTFSLASGSLPPGITLSSDGVLSGTPMGTVGTYDFTVRASNAVPPDATQSVNFELTPGWPATIQVDTGNLQSATTNHVFGVPLRLVVRDAAFNPVPLATVDFAVPSGGASATLSTYSEATAADGSVTTLATANGIPGSYAITATTPGLADTAVFNLTNQAGSSPAQLALSGFTAHGYGDAVTFLVSAHDAGTGNALSAGTVRVTVNDVEACRVTLPITQCRPAAPIEIGTFIVRAFLDSPTHSAPVFESTILIGKHQGSMQLTAPASATAGSTITVHAKATFIPPGATLFPGTVMPFGDLLVWKDSTLVCRYFPLDPNGEFDCAIPVTGPGDFVVKAEYEGDDHWQALVASKTVSVASTANPPAFTSSPPGGGQLGVAYRHTFTASGTSPIVFSIKEGVLPAGLELTNDGMLTGIPTAAGTFALLISAGNSAGSATQAVTLFIAAPARTHVEIASGNRQSAVYDRARIRGEAFAHPLVVRVVDPAGIGVAGQRVEFLSLGISTTGARAILSAQSVISDAKGEASVTAIADMFAGAHKVRAMVTGLDPVFFDLFNVPSALGELRLLPVSAASAARRAPLLAPFPVNLKVKVEDATNARALLPGREVRFYVPEPPGSRATATLEGISQGKLTPRETTRPDDGRYFHYATAITGADSIAQATAYANGVAGTYDVIAVLVEDGSPVDPLVAPASKRVAITLENQDVALGIQVRPSTVQRADPGEPFPQGATATLFLASEGVCCGGINGAEVWLFAEDDANGKPGATILSEGGIEGRLPGGERYVAVTTDIRGNAGFDVVANRYEGQHRISAAYPGAYASLAAAPVKHSVTFINGKGRTPDGGTGEGVPAASIEIVSGDFQRGFATEGLQLPFPLVVRARDAAGQPLANVLVRFVPIVKTISSARELLKVSLVLSDSSVMTDGNGLAQVSAKANGSTATSFNVRASAEGSEPLEFTLQLIAPTTRELGATQLEAVPRISRGASSGQLGQDQPQVTLARFDETLSVRVVTATSHAGQPQAPVRFYFPPAITKEGKAAATFVPEGGTPGTFIDGDKIALPYVTLQANSGGIAALTGLANAVPGRYEVIAVAADPGADDNNDPHQLLAAASPRAIAFRLENLAPGATLTVLEGDAQSTELNNLFFRKIKVSAVLSDPDPRIAPGQPKGLDGGELWFMAPVPADDKTPGAALVADDVHTIIDGLGKPWRVVSVPIPGTDGVVEVSAVANDVPGLHRFVVAYPGNFTDPANAPGSVLLTLCNGQRATTPCRDAETTATTIEVVDTPPFFTYERPAPSLRLRVKNAAGNILAGKSIGLSTPAVAGITGAAPYGRVTSSSFSATVATDAQGVLDAGPGLSATTAGVYVVTARSSPASGSIEFWKYVAPTTIAISGNPGSSVLINTLHLPLKVTTPSRVALQWTVVPGANGAAATFPNGALTVRDVQAPTGAGAVIYTAPPLTANAIGGNFTLRASIIGASQFVDIPLRNLASLPAAVEPVDARAAYTYNTNLPKLRARVRGTDGNPLPGIPVTFTARSESVLTLFPAANGWVRNGSTTTYTRVINTGTDGIAILDDPASASINAGYLRLTIKATVSSVAAGADLPFVRYLPLDTMQVSGSPASATLINTAHARMQVRAANAVPLKWTVVPGSNGASGTFADGSSTLVTFPADGTTATASQVFGATVTANGIAGTFTLRVIPLDPSSAAPVDFTMTNLASAPASVEPVDARPAYTYTTRLPVLRALVRDANGAPLANVPVTLSVQSSSILQILPIRDGWARDGTSTTYTRVVITDASGIAKLNDPISASINESYLRLFVRASVVGVARPADLEFVRYLPVDTIRASGAGSSVALVGTAHARMTALLSNAVPAVWTIVPAANGASGRFADGSTTRITFPADGASVPRAQTSFADVIANGIPGTFTLRVAALDPSSALPLDFTLINVDTVPTTIEAVDPMPLYSYGATGPALRVIVRDNHGAVVQGVQVAFSVSTTNVTANVNNGWIRSGTEFKKFVNTNAAGIADAGAGFGLTAPYSLVTVKAKVERIANPAELNVVRYNPVGSVSATSGLTLSAPILTNYPAATVSANPAVPLKWTIAAASNGASGTFSNGGTTIVTFPKPSPTVLVQPFSQVVRANGIAGIFKVRVVPLDGGAAAPVEFTMSTMSGVPVSVERVGSGRIYTYGTKVPTVSVIVRDASGVPVQGALAGFSIGEARQSGGAWAAVGSASLQFETTDENGVAKFVPNARMPAIAAPYVDIPMDVDVAGAPTLRMTFVRYLELQALDPEDLVSVGLGGGTQRLRITADPPVPLRWTVVPAPDGTRGIFPNGEQVFETYPAAARGSAAPQTFSVDVRTTVGPGRFTVKAEAIGVEGPAVVFSVVNQ